MYVAWRKKPIGSPSHVTMLGYEAANAGYKGNGPYFYWWYRKALGLEHCQQGMRPITTSFRAELVENKRIDGKPRQQHIAYLATIDQDLLPMWEARFRFWQQAQNALDRLVLQGRMTSEQQDAVETQLAARVPRAEAKDKPPITLAEARALARTRGELGCLRHRNDQGELESIDDAETALYWYRQCRRSG